MCSFACQRQNFAAVAFSWGGMVDLWNSKESNFSDSIGSVVGGSMQRTGFGAGIASEQSKLITLLACLG